MTIGSTPISATSISVAVHGVAFVVVLVAFAAPAPLDSIGADVEIALAADLGDASEYEEDLAEVFEPLEPLEEAIVEPTPEPVIQEEKPLEELPIPEDDELLPEVEELTELPDFSLTVMDVPPPSRRTPAAEPPPVAPPPTVARVETPRTKPTPPQPKRRPTARAPKGRGRKGGSARRARLVPLHRPHHFPSRAQRMGISGSARVEMLISPSGQVVKVKIHRSSGSAVLDEAALSSARQWRFRAPGEYRRARQTFTFRMS